MKEGDYFVVTGENGSDDKMDSQTLRQNLLTVSRTPYGLSKETRLSPDSIYAALEEVVDPDWRNILPVHFARNSKSTVMIPPEAQEGVLSLLRVPFIKEIPYLYREGWRTLDQVSTEKGIETSSLRNMADQIKPDWRNDILHIPRGLRRRFYYLPPDLIANIERFASISPSRNHFKSWRLIAARNQSHFQLRSEGERDQEFTIYGQFFSRFINAERDDRFFNIFNFYEYVEPLSDEESADYMRAYDRGVHASKVIENDDLIAMSENDRAMVKGFLRQGRRALATLVLSHMPLVIEIANRCFNKIKKRRMKDVIIPQDLQEESVKSLFYSISSYSQSTYEGSLKEYILCNTQPWIQRYVHEMAEEYGDARTLQKWADTGTI